MEGNDQGMLNKVCNKNHEFIEIFALIKNQYKWNEQDSSDILGLLGT